MSIAGHFVWRREDITICTNKLHISFRKSAITQEYLLCDYNYILWQAIKFQTRYFLSNNNKNLARRYQRMLMSSYQIYQSRNKWNRQQVRGSLPWIWATNRWLNVDIAWMWKHSWRICLNMSKNIIRQSIKKGGHLKNIVQEKVKLYLTTLNWHQRYKRPRKTL